jgi:hypothetical protein
MVSSGKWVPILCPGCFLPLLCRSFVFFDATTFTCFSFCYLHFYGPTPKILLLRPMSWSQAPLFPPVWFIASGCAFDLLPILS